MRNTVVIILGSSSVVTPTNSLSNYSITTANSSAKASKCCCTSTSNTFVLQTSSSSSYTPRLSTVRWDLTFHRHQNRLNYYARLASKLVRDGNLHDFLLIAETVLQSGVKPYQFMALLQSDVVSEVMVEMLENGEINKVLDALVAVYKLGFDVLQLFDANLTEAFRKECRRREVEDVVDIFGILAGFNFPIKELVTPSEFIKLCVTKRKANAAVRYARYFPNAQILFCTIILEFGKKGDLVSALNTFEESKQDMDCPNMYIYRTVIDVCGLCGDFLRSRSIYEELQTQNITPNLYVFNSLMNVNSRDLSYTLQIYKNMQILGVAADMTSYNILLKSCCHASRVDLAQEIYREVQHLESTGLLKLDVFTYSTIVKVFADAKMWQMALEIKEDMLAAGVTPNTITWSSLINACASAGLVEQAISLFEEMLLADCKPNTQCCNIVLDACVEACQYDRAFRLFEIWKGNASKLSHRKDCQGNINLDVGRAYDSFRTNIPYSGSDSNHVHFTKSIPFTPTTATYNILMKACGTDHHRAKALMKEMKTLGLRPNHISWSIMIDIFGRSRNVRGAMQILNSMREAGIKPDVVAYTATIKVCVQHKHLKSAFALFEQMKIYQIQPNLVTYNTLLRARSRYGSVREVQQCLAIYQDMRKAGYNSNDYYLKQLIEEWCEGIIQGNKLNQGKHSCSCRSDLGGPQSFLLEKVAANLQNTGAESYVVDLQGLTKVESRIVVLSFLQMIKEKYGPGNSVKDDMVIILGNQGVGSEAVSGKFDLKEAMIKLLCDDLGLQVVADFEPAAGKNINAKNPSGSYPDSGDTVISNLPALLDSPTRRPVDLVRLKVTKKSLLEWLQKRLRCS